MERLPDTLVREYGFDSVEIGAQLPRGYSAQNYPVTTSAGTFFLKAYNQSRTRERLQEMHTAEQFFEHLEYKMALLEASPYQTYRF